METLKTFARALQEILLTGRAPARVAEPIRAIGRRVLAYTVTATAALAWATQNTNFLPDRYRDKATAAIGIAGGVVLFVTKVATEVMRSKVFSPRTHEIEVAQVASPELHAT